MRVLGALAMLWVIVLSGCQKSSAADSTDAAPAAAGAEAPAKPAAGVISGKVTFADGKPIDTPGADLTVNIFGVSSAGEKVTYSPAVKADGTYKQKVVPGSYRFSDLNYVKLTFDNQAVQLRLEPIGTAWNKNQDAADGIVQDFVWKLIGHIPGTDQNPDNFTSWYGVSVKPRYTGYRNDLRKPTPALPDGTKLAFTFKPTGPRIDGKPAEPVTMQRELKNGEVTPALLNDLPCADYDLSGTIQLASGGSKPMVFEVKYAQFAPTQPLRFSAGSSTGFWPINVSFAYNE